MRLYLSFFIHTQFGHTLSYKRATLSRAVSGKNQGGAQRNVLMEWHSGRADHSSECLPSPMLHDSWLRHMLITKHISSIAMAPLLLFFLTSCLLARPNTLRITLTGDGRGQVWELIFPLSLQQITVPNTFKTILKQGEILQVWHNHQNSMPQGWSD